MLYSNIIFLIIFCVGTARSYREYKVEKICKQSLLRKVWNKFIDDYKTIDLDVDEAIVMNLSWNNSLLYNYDDCSFRIRVVNVLGGYKVRSAGIYASIRRLKLRKADIGQCYDYITIQHSNHQETNRICGSFDASPANVDKMPFFADDNGVLIVRINLDKFIPIKTIADNLEVSIVFTAYEDCETAAYHQIMCAPGHCISKSLENDGIVNCPPKYCLDEETCFTKPVAEEQLNHSNIALSALTSLIFTLFAVGLCLWVCWKYSNCKNLNSAQPRNSGATTVGSPLRQQRMVEPEFQTIELPPVFVDRMANESSAVITSPQSNDDKDLPPSYESLFSTPSLVVTVDSTSGQPAVAATAPPRNK